MNLKQIAHITIATATIFTVSAPCHAQAVDAGEVNIFMPQGRLYLSSDQYSLMELLTDFSVVTNGVDFQVARDVSASSYSGHGESSFMDIQIEGVFQVDPGRIIKGYQVQVTGLASAYKSGMANLTVGVNAPSVNASTWQNVGFDPQPFSWVSTFLTSSTNPVLNLSARTSASYYSVCGPDDWSGCTYVQGSASITISHVSIQALLAEPVAAVPEADGIYLALAGAAGLATRRMRRRA